METIHKPENVEITERSIHIVWDDGHESAYPHRFLRQCCQCAHCVDEMTREQRLDPESIPEDVHAVDQMPIGNYAIQFLWSDTHYTGIYTFVFLREACPCRQCWEGRA